MAFNFSEELRKSQEAAAQIAGMMRAKVAAVMGQQRPKITNTGLSDAPSGMMERAEKPQAAEGAAKPRLRGGMTTAIGDQESPAAFRERQGISLYGPEKWQQLKGIETMRNVFLARALLLIKFAEQIEAQTLDDYDTARPLDPTFKFPKAGENSGEGSKAMSLKMADEQLREVEEAIVLASQQGFAALLSEAFTDSARRWWAIWPEIKANWKLVAGVVLSELRGVDTSSEVLAAIGEAILEETNERKIRAIYNVFIAAMSELLPKRVFPQSNGTRIREKVQTRVFGPRDPRPPKRPVGRPRGARDSRVRARRGSGRAQS